MNIEIERFLTVVSMQPVHTLFCLVCEI